MDELRNQIIGPYRIEELLGQGGMGAVYRGVHFQTEQSIAIKVVFRHLADNPDFRKRFFNEAETLVKLDHANIVRVYEYGYDQGTKSLYLTMDLVTGGTLRPLLPKSVADAHQGLPELLDYLGQAARGLEYAHQHGVIHREVKPEDILLAVDAAQPGARRAKLTDFGLVRLIDQTTMTADASIGFLAYMAPEQFGDGPIDGRTDIYALGIILYEAVTGVLPFAMTSLANAVAQHLNSPPPSPRLANPAISAELEQVILRCLAKQPADRFVTAGELALALAAVPDVGKPIIMDNRGEPEVSPPLLPTLSPGKVPVIYVFDANKRPMPPVELARNLSKRVGRLPDNEIVLADKGVSRYHLEIVWDGSMVQVTDQRSANGTRLAGRTLAPEQRVVWPGDTWIQIERFWLYLQMPLAGRNAGDETVVYSTRGPEVGPSLTVVDPRMRRGQPERRIPPPVQAERRSPAEPASGSLSATPGVPREAPGMIAPRVTVFGAERQPLHAINLRTTSPIIVGRDPSSDVVLDHPSVSGRQVALVWNGKQVVVTDLEARTSVWLGSHRLLPAESRTWTPGDWLHVDPFWLYLQALEPPPPPPPSSLLVSLQTQTPDLRPGQATHLGVEVTNPGPQAIRATLEVATALDVVPSPASWVTVTPPGEMKLPPNGSEKRHLRVQVPRSPEHHAGAYQVEIWARTGEATQDGHTPATWTVQPFYASSVTVEAQKGRGWRRGTFEVTVLNKGNAAATHEIKVSDNQHLLRFQPDHFDPVTIPPGTTPAGNAQTVAVAVQAPWHLVGSSRSLQFLVMAPATDDTPADAILPNPAVAVFVQQALFPPWSALAALFLLAVVVLGIKEHPTLSVSANAVTFSTPQAVYSTSNAAQPLALSNGGILAVDARWSISGSAAADFTFQPACNLQALKQNCPATISFTPHERGKRQALLTIAGNYLSGTQRVILAGTGIAPIVNFQPSSINFGSRFVGSASRMTLTVANSGDAPLQLDSLPTIAGSQDFRYGGTTCPLPDSQVRNSTTCTVTIAFQPSGPNGSRAATLLVRDNAVEPRQRVLLSGQALKAVIALTPGGVSFGTQVVHFSTTVQEVTLFNTTLRSLSITTVITGADGANFHLDRGTCTGGPLASLGACAVRIHFLPGQRGAMFARLEVRVAGLSQVVANASLSGIGSMPIIATPSTTVKFGTVLAAPWARPAVRTVTLTNTGDASLLITGTMVLTSTDRAALALAFPPRPGQVTGDFAIRANTCLHSTVPPQQSCAVEIAFQPRREPPGRLTLRNAYLLLAGNIEPPFAVHLQGQGELARARIAVPGQAVTFFDRQIMSSTERSINVSNKGTAPLSVTGVRVTDANSPPWFTADTGKCTKPIERGGRCQIQVSFKPMSIESDHASLTITYVDTLGYTQNSPAIALEGNGHGPMVQLSWMDSNGTTRILNPGASISFGRLRMNNPTAGSSVILIVTNNGNAYLNVQQFLISDKNFVIDPNSETCTYAPVPPNGSSCQATIRLVAHGTSRLRATLEISDDAYNSPQVVYVTG